MIKKLSTLDATFVVLMAACGISLKPIVGPMAKMVASALFMPAGSIAGAVYMMWPALAALVVRQFGAATLVGLIEGVIVLVTGFYGSHGILSLITYVIPCFVIDLGFLFTKKFQNKFTLFFPPALGNLSGALIVGLYIMHMPTIPLIISLIPSFIFGGFAGWFAWSLYKFIVKSFPQFSKNDNTSN